MNQDISLKMVEMQKVREAIRPLVESFVNTTTGKQWTMLKAGQPDDQLGLAIAILVLEITRSLTDTFLEALRGTIEKVTEDDVKSSLGDTLSLSFSEALEIEDPVQCVSSQRFTSMIIKEVTENINSSLSSPSACQPLCRPCRLETIIAHAYKMLRAFAAKFNILCKRRQKSMTTETVEVIDLEQQSYEDVEQQHSCEVLEQQHSCEDLGQLDSCEDLEQQHTCEDFETDDLEPETLDEAPTEESFLTEMSEEVQSIISEEATNIIKCLTGDLSEHGHDYPESGDTLEIKALSDEIALSIHEEWLSSASEGSSEPEQKCKRSCKEMHGKIRACFSMHFVKVYILRMMENLKRKFKLSKVESRESLKSFIDQVEDLLLTEDGRHEVCVFQRLNNMPTERGHILTQALTDLMYRHIARVPSANSKQRYLPLAVPKRHAKLHSHIQSSIWVFLGLMRCWLSAQVDRRSQRTIRAIMDVTPKVFLSEELLQPEVPVVSEATRLTKSLVD